MDEKFTKLLTTFQAQFGGSLSNMTFLTDETLTLGQRSAVLSLAYQALRDAILEIQPSRYVQVSDGYIPFDGYVDVCK